MGVEDFYFFITNILNSRSILGLISLTETIRNTSSSSYIYPIKDDDVFFEFLKPERDPRIDIYVYVLLNTTNKSKRKREKVYPFPSTSLGNAVKHITITITRPRPINLTLSKNVMLILVSYN